MQIFVISIEEENSPRLTNFLAQPFFKRADLPYQKIGIKGGEIAAKAYFEQAVKGRSQPLSPGELGCTLSHLEALKQFLQSNDDYALIFEDDAVIPEFLEYQALKEALLKFDLPNSVLFSLGGIQMKECLKVRGKLNQQKFLDKKVLTVDPHFYSRACAAFAYIVDRKMANTLISYHGKIRKSDDWSCLYDFDPSVNLLMTHLVDHPDITQGEQDCHLSHLEQERFKSQDLPVSKYGSFTQVTLTKLFSSRYKAD